MSLDEISVFLRYKKRQDWDNFRWELFKEKTKQKGLKEGETPEDLLTFSWENKESKPVKKLTKEEIAQKSKQAEEWLDKKR